MIFYSYTETLVPDIVGLQMRACGVGICSTLLELNCQAKLNSLTKTLQTNTESNLPAMFIGFHY